MKKDILKKYAAYPVAIVLFLLAAYIYCSPLLQGRVLGGGDRETAKCVIQESLRYHNETGDYTFWTGSLFSGMPNYQIGGGNWKSDTLLNPFIRIVRGPYNAAWCIFLYLVCFFVLLRSFKVGRWLSIAGAFAIALSSYFLVIIAAGHMSKCATLAIIALAVAGFRYIFDGHLAGGAILVMFAVACGFSQHPQMFYYYYMMLGLFWIAELFIHIKSGSMKKFWLATLVFVAATGIGLGAKSSNVMANAEYVKETQRGGSGASGGSGGLDLAYATQWSYGIDETMTFLIPGFRGGASSVDVGRDSDLYRTLVKKGVPSRSAADFCSSVPLYWGEQPFTAGNVYMGAVVCFLFILGLAVVRGPYKWALLASTLMSVFLAWGSNMMWLTEFFFKYFPLYNKFRAVSSILIVAEVAMPLLGFIALKEIFTGNVAGRELRKGIGISAGITAGICLFFALAGPLTQSFTSSYDASWAEGLPKWAYAAIIGERIHLFTADCWRSFIFIALAATALWLYSSGTCNSKVALVILAVLIVTDEWPVDKRYLNDSNFVRPEKEKPMQPWETEILKDKDYFRVFNLTVSPFNDARTSYYLNSIGGYSAAKLRRYQDLIDRYLSKMNMPVINMLNTRYFIVNGNDGKPQVQYNPDSMGNAWFIDRLEFVANADAELSALGSIDLTHEAVADSSFAAFLPQSMNRVSDNAFIHLESHSPKELVYVSENPCDGTAVFSEIYYPYGWKASIDGVPSEHFRVNYVLRAINAPAGRHEIRFVFDPDSVRRGNTIATVFIVLMYLLLAATVFVSLRRRR